jgi:hypothetical protein
MNIKHTSFSNTMSQSNASTTSSPTSSTDSANGVNVDFQHQPLSSEAGAEVFEPESFLKTYKEVLNKMIQAENRRKQIETLKCVVSQSVVEEAKKYQSDGNLNAMVEARIVELEKEVEELQQFDKLRRFYQAVGTPEDLENARKTAENAKKIAEDLGNFQLGAMRQVQTLSHDTLAAPGGGVVNATRLAHTLAKLKEQVTEVLNRFKTAVKPFETIRSELKKLIDGDEGAAPVQDEGAASGTKRRQPEKGITAKEFEVFFTGTEEDPGPDKALAGYIDIESGETVKYVVQKSYIEVLNDKFGPHSERFWTDKLSGSY